jgi:hypothetical protein
MALTVTVMALFDDRRHADQALQALLEIGLTEKEISVVAHDVIGEYAGTLPGPGQGRLNSWTACAKATALPGTGVSTSCKRPKHNWQMHPSPYPCRPPSYTPMERKPTRKSDR